MFTNYFGDLNCIVKNFCCKIKDQWLLFMVHTHTNDFIDATNDIFLVNYI